MSEARTVDRRGRRRDCARRRPGAGRGPADPLDVLLAGAAAAARAGGDEDSARWFDALASGKADEAKVKGG